mmetsp:Transcript_8125/g.14129  ORF Transcript_8125/g.14129 Transcript_8125/m.14129 type:complete len:200 (+) Transcript_8125:752-1351(+)
MNALLPKLLSNDAAAFWQQLADLKFRPKVIQLQHCREARQRHCSSIGIKRVNEMHEIYEHLQANVTHVDHGHRRCIRTGHWRCGSVLQLCMYKIIQSRGVGLQDAEVCVQYMALATPEAHVRQHVTVDQSCQAVGQRLVRLRNRQIVHSATGHSQDSFALKASCDQGGRWLVWVTVAVNRHALTASKAQLPTGAGTPTI